MKTSKRPIPTKTTTPTQPATDVTAGGALNWQRRRDRWGKFQPQPKR